MARLVVLTTPGEAGTISCALRDGQFVGYKVDYDAYVARHGSDNGFPDRFVIIDVPDMSLEEAERLAAPVIEYETFIDPDFGTESLQPKAIPYHSTSLIDYPKLEQREPSIDPETGLRRDTLTAYRKITRLASAVMVQTAERSVDTERG